MKRTLIARDLRTRSTRAERDLWEQLRAHRLGGYYFRRQYPIGPYVVDFICRRCGVIVEVDGEYHKDQIAADIERMRFLEALGYTVVRFSNDAAFAQMPYVLKNLLHHLKLSTPPLAKGRGRGRGQARAMSALRRIA